jgi:DNA-binding response OmpR family regulator
MTNRGRNPKKLILIVDDEDLVRRMLGLLLKIHGFRVLQASTGNDALRICARFRRPIDLMITDIQMPELPGFDLARLTAAVRPEMAVLFISGAFSEQDPEIRENLSPGRDFLAKPFTPKVLASKVESLLAIPRDFAQAAPCQESLQKQFVPA